jgi:DNA polymerase-3 subunit alpha
LTGLIPLRKDKDGALAIEYDKEKAEDNGLVKMDTLGLSTLDIIGQAVALIRQTGKTVPDNLDYDEYDESTYKLISSGDTFCVFQLGTSAGTVDLCRRIKPTSINDISYVNALARPSARDMRNDFIATKDGKKPFALLHPKLGRAFNNTFGFGLYEESLMYLAQDVAGWSLHSADRLRKLTKEKGKNPQKALQWRTEFIRDAMNNQVNEEIAKRIWDEVVDKFQGYGFNMSHSVLYSMTSYKTAYLKAHYPIEFLLANLMAEVKSNTPDAKNNIEKIKKELRSHSVKIIPPDINKSQLTYTIDDGNKLITGLDALKFVGEDAINDIISKRPFKSFFDFMVRIDSKKVRANSIQALAAAGAMDSFNIPRKLIFLYVSDYRKKLQVWLKKHDPTKEEFYYPWTKEENWKLSELYALEQFYLGESFVCKPADAYGNFFKQDDHLLISDIKKVKDKTNVSSIKAIIKDFFEFKVKKETSKYYGQSMIKATIEDKQGNQCTCTIFPDRWKIVQERLKEISSKAVFEPGVAIHFGGNTNNYEDDVGIILDHLYNASLTPVVPADLKAKKVSLKEVKAGRAEIAEEIVKKSAEIKNLLEKIEDSLYDNGLIDLDEENDD